MIQLLPMPPLVLHIHMCTNTYKHTLINTQKHGHTQVCTRIHSDAMNACTYTHSCTYTCICTHSTYIDIFTVCICVCTYSMYVHIQNVLAY